MYSKMCKENPLTTELSWRLRSEVFGDLRQSGLPRATFCVLSKLGFNVVCFRFRVATPGLEDSRGETPRRICPYTLSSFRPIVAGFIEGAGNANHAITTRKVRLKISDSALFGPSNPAEDGGAIDDFRGLQPALVTRENL